MNVASRDEALNLAKRFQKAISGIVLDTGPITASIGISGRTGHLGPSQSELLIRADRALYQAKAAGKSRAVID